MSRGYPSWSVRHVLFAFVGLNALVVAAMPLLPFIDLPNHLAEAIVYQSPQHPENLLAAFYQPVPWYFPNSFHAVFCALFPSVEWGNKVFHILYLVLLHGSVFLVIRELNGNAWYGLLAILFTYNYNLTYGFVGFAISIPVLILLFYLVLVDMRKDGFLYKVLIALSLMILFLMHAQNALLGVALYGMLMLYHYRGMIWRRLLSMAMVVMPVVLMIFAWWYNRPPDNTGSTLEYLIGYYTSGWFETFPMRGRIVVFDNFQLFEGWIGIVVAAFFFLSVLVPLMLLRPWQRPHNAQSRRDIAMAFVFFFTAFLCYMLLPDQLPGQTPLFQRFCSIVMLAFIIFGSVWLGPFSARWLTGFVIAVCVLYSALWIEYLWTFNRQNSNFNREFFAGLDNREVLAGLIYENKYRGRKVYIHFPNYFIVWNLGLSTTKIIDYRFGIVRRAARGSTIPFYHELIGERYRFQPQYRHVDLFLVRGDAPVSADAHLDNFVLLRRAGLWSIYRRETNAYP